MGGGEEKDRSNKSFLVLLRKECSTGVKSDTKMLDLTL